MLEELTAADLQHMITAILADSQITLADHLEIEEMAYVTGILR